MKERGSHVYSLDKANEVLAVKWNDNSVVALATNFQTVFSYTAF